MTLAASARLNHYQILSPLGAGGMGEVYLAEDITYHFGAAGRAGNRGETPAQEALYAAENAYATLMAGFTTVQRVGAAADVPGREITQPGNHHRNACAGDGGGLDRRGRRPGARHHRADTRSLRDEGRENLQKCLPGYI